MAIKSVNKNNINKKLIEIFGENNVLTDISQRFCYSFDCSDISQCKYKLPIAIVFPQKKEQLVELVKIASFHNIPLTPRAASTNHVGSCVPIEGGIVVSFSKMDKILEINPENLTATVQPGVVIQKLEEAVSKYNLFFPPDPSNLKVSTIGGAVAQGAGGPRGFKYGTTKDYVLDIQCILPNSEVINTGKKCHKNAAGYNLTGILIGSEGTLGLFCEITLRLLPKPEAKNVMLVYYNNIVDAANSVCSIINNHILPSVIELMDKNTLETIEKFIPSGFLTQFEACLLIEVDGFKNTIEQQCDTIKNICKQFNSQEVIVASTFEDVNRIWQSRRSAYACCTKLDQNVVADDVVVPRENIPKLVLGINEICKKNNVKVCIMGHIGDGNIHPNFALNLKDNIAKENYLKSRSEILKLAVSLNGSITGEHGVGVEKKEFLEMCVSSKNVELMKNIKKVFDPKNILNPGKIV